MQTHESMRTPGPGIRRSMVSPSRKAAHAMAEAKFVDVRPAFDAGDYSPRVVGRLTRCGSLVKR